ncbi:MAG TPA: hypothetical protein VJT13_24405 [Xanthobacteraceae bacterium]|nr:hypothetical protein [Xanthobacteraceae bacterium]
MTKTKIALAAVLVAATASLASAQEFDPNLANRYPAYNGPAVQGPQGFTSSEVRLGNRGYANQVTTGRAQAYTFQYDSAPVISGGGY